ncbi:hypothetical protein D3C75_1280620 [compost metagenome]
MYRPEQPVVKQYSYGKGPERTLFEAKKATGREAVFKTAIGSTKKVQGIGKELEPEVA